MPVDLSGVHQIIQAWIAGQSQRQQREQFAARQEQERTLQENLFKQQQELQRAEHTARQADLKAQIANANRNRDISVYMDLLGKFGSGLMPTKNRMTVQSPQILGGSQTVVNPDNPNETISIPGIEQPFTIPGEYVRTPEEMTNILAGRAGALTEAQTQAKMPLVEAQMKNALDRAIAAQIGSNLRNQATIDSREAEGEKNRQNRLDVARLRGQYAGISKTSPLDKPLSTSEAATYQVPVGTTLRDLTGVMLTKPLSPTQESRLNILRNVNDLANKALELGDKLKWSVFKPVTGNASSWWANVSGNETEDEADIRRVVNELKGTIARERGGTSFTPNEQRLMESYITNLTDNPARAKVKLTGLRQDTENKIKLMLGPSARPSAGEDVPKKIQRDGFNWVYDPVRKGYQKAGKIGGQ
jgi:hypothetical protein